MKKYLLLVAIAFVSFNASAQNFAFAESTIQENEADETIFEVVGHNEVTNNLGATREYTWVREEISMPSEWQSAVCDIVRCYLPDSDSQSFELLGLQTGLLDVHTYPNGVAGEGHVKITVTNNDDGTTAAADYFFNIGATSTGELESRSIQVFPNPAIDVLNITDSFNDISEVSIYNVIGRQIKTYAAAPNGQYNVSNLKPGLYLVQLIDSKGGIIRTVRMNKN